MSVVTDDTDVSVAVRADTAARTKVNITEWSLGTAVHVLIGRAQHLPRLQTLATHHCTPHCLEDVVAGLAIHASEVVSVHLPDEGSSQSIVISISHLHIH